MHNDGGQTQIRTNVGGGGLEVVLRLAARGKAKLGMHTLRFLEV